VVILALDTSHPEGSVSLSRDGVVVATETFATPASHLIALSQAVERLLAAAKTRARSIERVAVVIGPGSFTGLRIGLSFAKGLHAAGGMDIVPIDSLHLLALPFLDSYERVCALIDARRGEVYAGMYARAPEAETSVNAAAVRVVAAPCARRVGEFLDASAETPDAIVGNGVAASRAHIDARYGAALPALDADARPSTALLAVRAPGMPALSEDQVRTLEPLYLRPSGAERVRLRGHAPDASDSSHE
jgi:tRNA threonylcarbamoyladenosine biosynthesis protein TsaB